MSWKTPSYTSPKSGSRRACLCLDGTYSRECCDGSLQAQGIGPIVRVDKVRVITTEGRSFAITTESGKRIATEQ